MLLYVISIYRMLYIKYDYYLSFYFELQIRINVKNILKGCIMFIKFIINLDNKFNNIYIYI